MPNHCVWGYARPPDDRCVRKPEGGPKLPVERQADDLRGWIQAGPRLLGRCTELSAGRAVAVREQLLEAPWGKLPHASGIIGFGQACPVDHVPEHDLGRLRRMRRWIRYADGRRRGLVYRHFHVDPADCGHVWIAEVDQSPGSDRKPRAVGRREAWPAHRGSADGCARATRAWLGPDGRLRGARCGGGGARGAGKGCGRHRAQPGHAAVSPVGIVLQKLRGDSLAAVRAFTDDYPGSQLRAGRLRPGRPTGRAELHVSLRP